MKEGFSTKLLGDVVDVIGGGTPSKRNPSFYGGTIPWATVRDMNTEKLSDTEHSITQQGLNTSSSKVIPAGEVIIATRVGLGKVCMLVQDTAINQDLRGLVPKKGAQIDRFFLFYWYKSISQTVVNAGTGATVQGVKLPFVKGLQIPLPPLEEQLRIVAVLDEAFEGLDRARVNTQANLQNARELFDEMEIDCLNEGAKISTNSTLGSLATFRNGLNYSRSSQGEKVKIVGVGDFKNNFEVPVRQLATTKIDGKLAEDDQLLAGDILAVRSNGNRELIGRTMLMPKTGMKISFSGFTIRIRLHSKELLPEYLCSFMRTKSARATLTAGGGGANISNLNQRLLSSFPVCYPNTELQLSRLKYLHKLRQRFGELRSGYEKKLQDLENLRQSILQKAFSGELTASKQYAPPAHANDNENHSELVIALAYGRHQTAGKEATFGHVKAQKILSLTESLCDIDLGREPTRQRAGPNDMPHMNRMEDRAAKQQAFKFRERPGGYTFETLSAFDSTVREAQHKLTPIMPALNKLIELVVNMDTQETEVLATVHAAWNNLIIDKAEIDNEAIVRAAREDWHPDKMDIARPLFFKAIATIKSNGIEPDGTAKYVPAMQESLF